MASFEEEYTKKFTPEEKKLFNEVLKHYKKDGPANAPYSEAEMQVAYALKAEFDKSPGTSSIQAAARAVNNTLTDEYVAYRTTSAQAAKTQQALVKAEKASDAAFKNYTEASMLAAPFARNTYQKAEDKALEAFSKNLDAKQIAGRAETLYTVTLDDIRLPDFGKMAQNAGLKSDKGGHGR